MRFKYPADTPPIVTRSAALPPEVRQALGTEVLSISNDGPEILGSSYWGSASELCGFLYLTPNAGVWRLLLPDSFPLNHLGDVKGVAITEGRSESGRAVEVLFDDGSDCPYAAFLSMPQVERQDPTAERKSRQITLWQSGPRKVASFPCYYRRAPTIPCLRPWDEL